MKRLVPCALAILLCMGVSLVDAQSLWQWQYPKLQGNTLGDIDIMEPSTAVAVGAYGAVVKTTDGGATWSVSTTMSGLPSLRGVSFVDATTIVVVGDGGVILRSVDGGETWNPRASGTTNILLDVEFADALHGTAVGRAGTVLRSNDGGITWTPQTSGTGASLNGVSVVDASTATAVGSSGTILRTEDGGATWTAQSSGSTVPLYGVDFIDANTGIAVGHGPTALGTTDGGATWSHQLGPPDPGLPPTAVLSSVYLSDATHAVAVGTYDPEWMLVLEDTGVIMSTNDGGASWSSSTEPTHLFGIAMFASGEGLAVGAAGKIRRMTDGAQVGGGLQRHSMQGVDFFDALHGVAVSTETRLDFPTSRAYATSDGGATWTVVQPFAWSDMFDVTFADATTVYAVGNGPRPMDAGASIWRSDDGGMTWAQYFGMCCFPCAPQCISRLVAVDFVGPNAGVAVGSDGGIVTILSGVVTWVSPPTVERLNGVSVPTPTTAYAVGDNGVILKGFLESGVWVELASGFSLPLYDVCFTDEVTGTVVGALGTILRTTDGGATWIQQASGTPAALTSVSFLDGLNGIIGTGTTLLKTMDGGGTWVPERMPSANVSYALGQWFAFDAGGDVVYIDQANVAAVGGHENIVARRDVHVPILFQDFAASALPHSVELRWTVHADEAFRGFRVYRSDGHAREVVVTSELIAPTERSFIDHDVAPGASYRYTLAAVDRKGTETRSRPVSVSVPRATFALFQNHPNPFNPTTRIRFALPEPMRVTLNVFDIGGRQIVTLVDGIRPSGEHVVTWDGRNEAGDPAGSGIYFYELRTSGSVAARKMVLLK